MKLRLTFSATFVGAFFLQSHALCQINPPPLDDISLSIAAGGEANWGWADSGPAEFQPVSLLFNVSPTPNARNTAVSLRRIRYQLVVDPPPPPQPGNSGNCVDNGVLPCPFQPPVINPTAPECLGYFFDGAIDLYGRTSPASIRVDPGLQLPKGKKLRVCAWASYSTSGNSKKSATINATREFPISAADGGGQYLAFRQAFVRSHVLDAGRQLTTMPLKQFEPTRDPAELLYHSLTLRFPGYSNGPTYLYVPWLHQTVDGVRADVPFGAVYGGDENPLLRTGLGMAAFAFEYRATGSRDSLRHANQMLRWMLRSEYRNSQGQLTGFLLRTRDPSLSRPGGHYFFASVDELAGVVLGMSALADALASRPQSDSALRREDDQIEQSLQGLLSRIATHLSNSNYFIVPPAGFPRMERQLGWSGTYLYEWYLRRVFRYVLSRDFPPSMTPANFASMLALPWGRPGETDDLPGIQALLALNLSPEVRAELAIQGIGVARYLGRLDTCPTREVVMRIPVKIRGVGINAFSINLTARDLRPHMTFGPGPYFNLAMLMHFYQAQALSPPDATALRVNNQMDLFLDGLVGINPSRYTTIDLKTVGGIVGVPLSDAVTVGAAPAICVAAAAVLTAAGFPVPPSLCTLLEVGKSVDVHMGDCAADENYYAAAIDQVIVGTNVHQSTIDSVISDWHRQSAVGNMPNSLIAEHNAQGWLGSGFAFERGPECQTANCVVPRQMVIEREDGITPQMISDATSRQVDVLRHGAGLDFLLPTALLMATRGTTGDSNLDMDFKASVNKVTTPRYLAACTTSPLEPEPPAGTADTNIRDCVDAWRFNPGSWDSGQPDESDLVNSNLTCGNPLNFSIDHSTHYGRRGKKRQAPYQGRAYTGSGAVLSQALAQADPQAIVRARASTQGMIPEPIWTTDDIDYFVADCRRPRLRVRVAFETVGQYYRVVVNGRKFAVAADGKLDITTSGGPSLIKITGDSSKYRLQVDGL